jgi:hypothetical protein
VKEDGWVSKWGREKDAREVGQNWRIKGRSGAAFGRDCRISEESQSLYGHCLANQICMRCHCKRQDWTGYSSSFTPSRITFELLSKIRVITCTLWLFLLLHLTSNPFFFLLQLKTLHIHSGLISLIAGRGNGGKMNMILISPPAYPLVMPPIMDLMNEEIFLRRDIKLLLARKLS